MEPFLKRRLLVAIIIVALIIILLPVSFGHFKLKKQSGDVQNIPPAPNTSSAQSIPPSVDPITATVTPGNNSGDPLAQTSTNSSSADSSNSLMVNPNNTTSAPASSSVTIPAAQSDVPSVASTTTLPAANNISVPAVASTTTLSAANNAPAASVTTMPVTQATMPVATPMAASRPAVAPAQAVSLTAPVQSNLAAAPTPAAQAPASASAKAMVENKLIAPSSAPASVNSGIANDAAGSGKLPNLQPQSSLPDTDGSNSAPLASDDVNIPAGPEIIDESQPTTDSTTLDDTDDLGLPPSKKPAAAPVQSSAKPYHVRADDETSSNVVNNNQSPESLKLVAAPKASTQKTSKHQPAKVSAVTKKAVTHHAKVAKKPVEHKAVKVAVGEHWVIQVASFPEQATAQSVVKELVKHGHHAFVGQAEVNGKKMYRVYVGPFAKREQAENSLKAINSKMHTQGYVHSIKN